MVLCRLQEFFQAICISLLFRLAIADLENKCPERKAVVCYWASWSTYRPGDGNQKIGHIIPEYCTHIVYSFAGLDIDGKIISLDPGLDIQNGGFKDMVALRERDNSGCLKILLAIGGWGEGSEKYSLMAESESNREKFVESVVRYLIYYGFDGIDIDWEYPTQRNGLPSDQENFTKLLILLKEKLKPRNRIVTAAVTGALDVTKIAYEVKLICNELDYVSIMGYDFHDVNLTSIHSPLKAEHREERNTISDTVDYYVQNGCPAEKIILGVPAYGRTFTLKDARVTKVGASVSGAGKPGEYTRESGFLGYNEICEMQKKQKNWKKVYLDKNAAVYAHNGKLWISYDDERTIKQKADYVLEEGLGGMMIWSIDTDDFKGACSNVSYPLLSAINKGLKWNVKINERIK